MLFVEDNETALAVQQGLRSLHDLADDCLHGRLLLEQVVNDLQQRLHTRLSLLSSVERDMSIGSAAKDHMSRDTNRS